MVSSVASETVRSTSAGDSTVGVRGESASVAAWRWSRRRWGRASTASAEARARGASHSPTSAVLASVAAVARERADATSERSEQREDGRRDLRAVGADEAGEVAYVGEGASRVAALLRVKLVEGENVRGMAILVARRRVEGGAVGLDAGRGAVRVRVHVRKASEGRYQGYRAVVLDAMAARPRDATN